MVLVSHAWPSIWALMQALRAATTAVAHTSAAFEMTRWQRAAADPKPP